MADLNDVKDGKDFDAGLPAVSQGFVVNGGANYDWGVKNRLSRIVNPKSGQ